MSNEEMMEKFNLTRDGFYDAMPFEDGIGFSIKRDLKENDNGNTTLLSIYIPDYVLKNTENKKSLSVSATYGKKTEGGVMLRSSGKVSDPIDTWYNEVYFYDISTGEFYKKNKKINADDLIDEIYAEHIKSTKLSSGLWLRIKTIFWRVAIKSIFEYISKFFNVLLFLISGRLYAYDPILKNEKRTGIENKTRKYENVVKVEESGKFDFFGYKASQRAVAFYCAVHAIFYVIYYKNNYFPKFLIMIYKNNFLAVIYVVITLGVIDSVLPRFFEFCIKQFSRLSAYALYKEITI